MRGVENGFTQANHGKKSGLVRMKPGDGLVIYSPKKELDKPSEVLREFTAIGHVGMKDVYQAPDSGCWRRSVEFIQDAQPAPIVPLIPELSFITNKQKWGASLRFGFLKIPEKDFDLIYSKMVKIK